MGATDLEIASITTKTHGSFLILKFRKLKASFF